MPLQQASVLLLVEHCLLQQEAVLLHLRALCSSSCANRKWLEPSRNLDPHVSSAVLPSRSMPRSCSRTGICGEVVPIFEEALVPSSQSSAYQNIIVYFLVISIAAYVEPQLDFLLHLIPTISTVLQLKQCYLCNNCVRCCRFVERARELLSATLLFAPLHSFGSAARVRGRMPSFGTHARTHIQTHTHTGIFVAVIAARYSDLGHQLKQAGQ